MDDVVFAQITDAHLDPSNKRSLQSIRHVASRLRQVQPDVVLHTGDMVASADSSNCRAVINVMDHLGLPIWYVPGNREASADPPLERTTYQQYFGPPYHVHEIKGVCFLGLDTAGDGRDKSGNDGLGQTQFDWLATHLKAARQRPVRGIVCFLHMPVGLMRQPARKQLIDLLVRYDVDCVLSGHSHVNRCEDHDGIPEYLTAPCAPIVGPTDPPSFRLFRWTEDGYQQSLGHFAPVLEVA